MCPGREPELAEWRQWAEDLAPAGLSVTELGYRKKRDRAVVALPALPSHGVPYTHNNTVGNVVFTVRERVLGRTEGGDWVPTLKPEPGAFQHRWLVAFRRRVASHLPRHSLPHTAEEFCDEFRGKKGRRYQAALESLRVKPLGRADSYPGVFIKPEKWFEWKAGRVISARNPRYNIAVGRFVKPIEHDVYRAIDQVYESATIMKGYTPERRAGVVRGHWGALDDPVAVGQDFSKYDQHISKEALAYEHALYRHVYGSAELDKLLSWQLSTTCYANCPDGRVRYKVEGGRMSGDMNTALGNCIISAALIWAYAKEKGIKIRAVVDGDDSVTFLERRDLEKYVSGIVPWMRTRGFILKVEEPVFELSKVEFCQCRYVALEPATMVRNPLKAITHDHTWIQRDDLTHEDVLAATGLGGLSLYGNSPVLGSYYRMLSKASGNGAKTLARMERESSWLREARFTGKYTPPTEESRFALWESWGIAPEEQRQMEAYFDTFPLADYALRQRSQDHKAITTQVYFPSLLARIF